MIRSNEVTIRMIGDIRTNNNVLWMRLLELALLHAPVDAKTAIRQINSNDQRISALLSELAQ